MDNELLTDNERFALTLTAELAGLFGQIVGNGPSRENDLHEIVDRIHALQHLIMAQAAARAYPESYRLLGETLES